MNVAGKSGLRAATSSIRFISPRIPRRASSQEAGQYEHILASSPKPGVGLITFNRPKKLNALFTPLIHEVNDALRTFDEDKSVGAMVLTGSEKAFAAGADINEMRDLTFSSAYTNDYIASWSAVIPNLKKPLISAVNGYALGGGCELAMMADILYCSEGATFGQPELSLGVIPGAAGSQRLTRAIGKAKAMDMILTGKSIKGPEAERCGLAARCFSNAQECLEGAVSSAEKIASFSKVATKAAKEAVNKSQELPLREGVEFERRLFHALFGSKDQKIGKDSKVAPSLNRNSLTNVLD
ncbi:MAG: hypothetical protein M1831_007347 [Alyxoria varia]|nr:MAG: hypothetical protein M1831_007347 [Alyxoria varia]